MRRPCACNTHVAFSVPQEMFAPFVARLVACGITSYKENTFPEDSFYFLDPDGHELEIHTGTWQSRLAIRKKDPGPWRNLEWFEVP